MSVVPGQKTPDTEGGGTAALEGETAPARSKHTIGALLRETRESYGGDIERIANALRIRAQYLIAIEEGRYDRLPAPVYALGFVRAYANHLNLDGEEAVRRFKQEASGFEISRDLVFPTPLGERGIPHGRILAAAVLLLLAAYGAWYYLSSGGRMRPERVSPVPAALAPPPAASTTPAAPAPATVPSAPPSAVPPTATSSSPAPLKESSPPVSPPVTPALTPPPPPASGSTPEDKNVAPILRPPPGMVGPHTGITPPTQTAALPPDQSGAVTPGPGDVRVFGATDAVRVILRARSDCWVKVTDPRGTVVFERLLRAGDVYRVPDEPGLQLFAGNAGGLAVVVDGRNAPSLTGRVRHDIRLDPERLMAGMAVVK